MKLPYDNHSEHTIDLEDLFIGLKRAEKAIERAEVNYPNSDLTIILSTWALNSLLEARHALSEYVRVAEGKSL